MPAYRNASTHAVTLASGRPLAPGEDAPTDLKDPHDQQLAADGALTKVEQPDTKERGK
jgi:hypothetical protein